MSSYKGLCSLLTSLSWKLQKHIRKDKSVITVLEKLPGEHYFNINQKEWNRDELRNRRLLREHLDVE